MFCREFVCDRRDDSFRQIIKPHFLQQNGHDCGIFICHYMNVILHGGSLQCPFDSYYARLHVAKTLFDM